MKLHSIQHADFELWIIIYVYFLQTVPDSPRAAQLYIVHLRRMDRVRI